MSGKKGGFSYLALGSTLDSTGYRHNNSFHQKDSLGNFTYDVLSNLTMKLATGHHRDTYGQPGALYWSDLRTGTVDPKDSTRKCVSASASTEDNFLDFEPELRLGDDIVLTIGGSYRNRHISSHFDYGSGDFFNPMGQLQTYGFTPKVVFSRPLRNMKSTQTFSTA